MYGVDHAPGREEGEEIEGEEAGLARPRMYHFTCPCIFLCLSFVFPLPFLFPLPCSFLCLTSSGGSGGKEKGEPNYDGRAPRSVAGECRARTGTGKNMRGHAATMAVRVAFIRINITDNTHTLSMAISFLFIRLEYMFHRYQQFVRWNDLRNCHV